ncbi:MAG: TolC family protein [Kofleriaceae bacterium]
MRTLVFWALLVAPALAAAEPAKLTLDQVIAKAIANPRVQMAQSERDTASAQIDEADAARLPRIKGTAFATISPEIRCDDPSTCITTHPINFAWDFHGLFGGAELDITQPLYTFGKIEHARNAARAGLDAQAALANEAAGDQVSDAARAYWGLKLARELGGMLDDGIEQIEDAKKHFDDNKSLTITDRQRVAVLLAQAKAQRADAAQGEAQALAGLRAVTGDATADIDDSELATVAHTLPTEHELAIERRPQRLAAVSGAAAADELAKMQAAYYFPDIALVGTALAAGAQGVDVPPSVFANNPYNRYGLGLVLGLSWTIEPWNVKARSDRAKAEAHKAHAQAELATLGARYDAETALAEASAARTKVDAAATGEKAARTWLAAVLQNEAIGTAESRDLVDAYVAWFTLRAQWATAVVAWNVAVIRLGRATGEFTAGPARPR